MPDTIKAADELNAAGFDHRQARAILRAQAEVCSECATKPELEKVVARLEGMDRWLKFIAVGVAAVMIKLFLD